MSRTRHLPFPKTLTAFLPGTSRSLGNSTLSEGCVTLCVIPVVRSGLKVTLLRKSASRKSQLFLWSPFPYWRQLFINLGTIKDLLVTDLTSSSCCSWVCPGERINTLKEVRPEWIPGSGRWQIRNPSYTFSLSLLSLWVSSQSECSLLSVTLGSTAAGSLNEIESWHCMHGCPVKHGIHVPNASPALTLKGQGKCNCMQVGQEIDILR